MIQTLLNPKALATKHSRRLLGACGLTTFVLLLAACGGGVSSPTHFVDDQSDFVGSFRSGGSPGTCNYVADVNVESPKSSQVSLKGEILCTAAQGAPSVSKCGSELDVKQNATTLGSAIRTFGPCEPAPVIASKVLNCLNNSCIGKWSATATVVISLPASGSGYTWFNIGSGCSLIKNATTPTVDCDFSYGPSSVTS